MLHPLRTRVKVAAVVMGVLVAGLPIMLVSGWLEKQGERDVTDAAASILSSAEMQISGAVAAVHDLSARGVDSCGLSQIDAMHQAVLSAASIKEIMLVDSDDRIACTDAGSSTAQYESQSSSPTDNGDINLDVVRMPASARRFVRIRNVEKGGKSAIAALIPAGLLLPQNSMQSGYARISMADGTLVVDGGTTPEPASARDGQFNSRMQSSRYGFFITASMARDQIMTRYDDLRGISIVVSGVIVVLMLAFGLIVSRRRPQGPGVEIARAILADEFVPYYQPVVDIQSGRLLGAEVLARWRRADGTLVEPIAFVSLMESSGLALELTRSLMRRARDDTRRGDRAASADDGRLQRGAAAFRRCTDPL